MNRLHIIRVITLLLLSILGREVKSQDEFVISQGTDPKNYPAISGDMVVWQEYYINTDHWNIYYNFLGTGSHGVCAYNATNPDVDGMCIVSDLKGGSVYSGYMWPFDDASERFRVDGSYPAIDNYTIVTERDEDIQGNHGAWDEFYICQAPGRQTAPYIKSGLVVWMDNRYGDWDIYSYRLLLGRCTGDVYSGYAGKEIAISNYIGQQEYPVTDGHTIVWQDNRNGDYDIYFGSFLGGVNIPLYEGPGDQKYPAIDHKIVVWMDNRHGDWDVYGRDWDLVVYEDFPICTLDGSNQTFPDISRDTVVWVDNRKGYDEIYGCKIVHPDNDFYHTSHIAEVGRLYSGTTRFCTGKDETELGGYQDCYDVWYSFTPEVDGEFTISLCDSDFDTTLAMFDVDQSGWPGNELAFDANGCGIQSSLIHPLDKGSKYYIRIAGNNGRAGEYQLSISGPHCDPELISDVNRDCRVNLEDIAILANEWLECNLKPPRLCF